VSGRIEGRTDRAPSPAGPYSQSVRIGAVVAASGQGGAMATGGLSDGVADQTRQALANVSAALTASGATLGDVVHVRVYLTDPEDFAAMNAAYESCFTAPFPARTTVYVGLPPGLLVEIDALAVLEEPGASRS
jgi:reactive intermediate/imine deaminase